MQQTNREMAEWEEGKVALGWKIPIKRPQTEGRKSEAAKTKFVSGCVIIVVVAIALISIIAFLESDGGYKILCEEGG